MLDKVSEMVPGTTVGVETDVKREKGEIKSQFVLCMYGPGNSKDYVLHIEPIHPRRPFPPNLTPVYQIVRKHLHDKFPLGTVVEIDPPDIEWKLQHIVFSAKNVMEHWSFNENDIEKTLPALLEELEALIEKYAAQQRR